MLKPYKCRVKMKLKNPKLCRSEANIAERTIKRRYIYDASKKMYKLHTSQLI